ncbi:MAG: type II toxin-antitoxin system prevent-host-death family antitoxin, partial [Acidobacteriota bacterium]
REIAAGEFKARCLALLDEVGQSGDELIVTKRGRPVARVVPIKPPRSLRGSVSFEGDLITPLDDWDSGR